MLKPSPSTAVLLCTALMAAATHAEREAGPEPQGGEKSGRLQLLESGARLLQGNRPLHGFDVYLVGFHPMKANPELQMEAHHLCKQVNEDFAQCVLFDGNGDDANLNGIEYIISERLFESLPAEERQYWHPHPGEILSGQLVAPGIPDIAEMALMKQKMNSYGKTWHLWNTGHHGKPADTLPLGDARLAWSFNRDGEILPGMLEARDKAFDLDTSEIRARRQEELRQLARPQEGVDALQGKFPRETRAIDGVVQKSEGHH
jgi:hypothetical protein